MLEFMKNVIFEITGKKQVTYDTDFIQDLGLNSFDIMNIISAFEDHFDITIPTLDVWQLHQVRDAVEYMHKRGFDEP